MLFLSASPKVSDLPIAVIGGDLLSAVQPTFAVLESVKTDGFFFFSLQLSG
jgi:hypothetical protein